jgi:anti-sigma B factor antagonist
MDSGCSPGRFRAAATVPPLPDWQRLAAGFGTLMAKRRRSRYSPGRVVPVPLRGAPGPGRADQPRTRPTNRTARYSTMTTHSRIDVSKVGDVSIVKFRDKKILDEASIQELGAELFALVEQQNRKAVLLNFDGVEFLSSAALGKLITFDRKVKAAKGRLKLSNIRPEILEVFQVTKLNRVFDIRGEEAEAISAF